MLAQLKIVPHMVETGADAVAAWEQRDWDLILLDVQMPVMDGPTACRVIRKRESETGRARTPIIAISANAMAHQVEAYLAAGMDGFIAKPIEIVRLFEVIGEAERARAGPDAVVAPQARLCE